MQVEKYELSDMDKMGFLKQVRVCIFYELQPTIDQDELVSSIIAGVRNATGQLPFLAGNLQFDGSGKLYITVPKGSEVEVNIQRFVSTEHKSLSALALESFSPNLDLTPFLPEDPTAGSPVCTLQLSIIDGGLVLGLRMNHAAGDWSSIDTFLSLVCKGSKASQQGLEMPIYTPDLNRTPYNTPEPNPSIPREDRLDKLPIFYVTEKRELKASVSHPSPFKSSIYKISEPCIQQIKENRTPYLSGVDYITSYDCISALIWTSITRARLHLHPEKAASPCRFVHPIDVRTRDRGNKSSDKYFGNGVIGTQTGTITAQALVSDGDQGLATAASLIRQSVNSTDLSSISHLTALMASLSPTETLGTHADFTDMDMFMNTWYSGSAEKYDIGFGAAAVPVAFRLPLAVPGACAVILPNFSRGPTRSFEVLVQLPFDEHELLSKDAEFLKYFKLVA